MNSLQQSGIGQTIGEWVTRGRRAGARLRCQRILESFGSTFTAQRIELPRAEELYRKFGAIQQSSRLQAVTDDVTPNAAAVARDPTASGVCYARRRSSGVQWVTPPSGASRGSTRQPRVATKTSKTADTSDRMKLGARRRAQMDEGFRRSSEAFQPTPPLPLSRSR